MRRSSVVSGVVLVFGGMLAFQTPASAASFTTIDFPGATNTYPGAISSQGDIVGGYPVPGRTHGFLLVGGTFTTVDSPGSTSTFLSGISPTGQMVGEYCDGSGCHGMIVTS
ncbi:MAG: hypothetical protein ACM3O7_10565 [Acidobacteriota bacterium]